MVSSLHLDKENIMPGDKEYKGVDRRKHLDLNPLLMEKLDRINGNVDQVKVISEDNRRALRGYNEKPGIVAGVKSNTDAIEDLENKSNRNDRIIGIMTGIGTIFGVIFGSD
jgi:hypothetical protein